ncbi:hypothetical protein LOK49_LG07G02110 [Camellia lanceoleosa]|uniref:Uncharacterized protein n=1 Tax=Camellia lanceoleosa TaxID=1840588 RepID=A0ACC0H066_9ERIC|nr:hypothetical protein LOK49_LG07G02110 [Camellia lanceoleosa]
MSSSSNNHGESSGSSSGGGLTYKDAGVDIDVGSELVRRIAKMAPVTGGFRGLFPLGQGQGHGTRQFSKNGDMDTVGDMAIFFFFNIFLCVIKPLFFLDYFATSRLDVDLAEKVIKGIVDGCQQSDCALLGGEVFSVTFLEPFIYIYIYISFLVYIHGKLVCFLVLSMMERKMLMPGTRDGKEQRLLEQHFPLNGVKCNKVLAQNGLSLNSQLPGETVTLGEALMVPTVIYVKEVLDIISKGGVKGIAHVTGGGFTDNIPRVFPKGLGALIYKDSWVILPVFKWKQEAGKIGDAEMRRTFNMGIGMVLVVSQEAAHRILGDAKGAYTAYRIGEVLSGDSVSYQ